MTPKEWEEVRRACHRWLSIHDPEYRKEYLTLVLLRHAIRKQLKTWLKYTRSTPKITTTLK